MFKKDENSPLSTNEARLVASWLESNGKILETGYVSVWKLTPQEVADTYKVNKDQVLEACRRK